jgi:hypothetical protein
MSPRPQDNSSFFEGEIARDLANAKTDIQIVKRDIQSLQFLYGKIDNTVSKIDGVTSKLEAVISIQERTMLTMEKLLNSKDDVLTKNLERMEKDNDAEVVQLRKEADQRELDRKEDNKIRDERIRKLEIARWLLIGALAIMSFLAPYVDRHLWPAQETSQGIQKLEK